ncbi:MAG TPA: hypothetical protein VE398_14375 [Acidobacteriota bacterium]|nr:hypothetical protein [Acidobacteriota bacterium]
MANDESPRPLISLRPQSLSSARTRTISNRLLVFIIACIIFSAGRAPFIGQWDSFDYLKQIVTHRLSDLGFGRPVFIGMNVLLWELLKRILRLAPLRVEEVVMTEIIIVGALGILIFAMLSRQLLLPAASRLAVLALLLSPMYALYSGFIMTEVPMLVALIMAAVMLWPHEPRHQMLRNVAAGVIFGLAVGVREQAVTMGAAYFWILRCRQGPSFKWLLSAAVFASVSGIVILGPVAAMYQYDPAGFARHMQVWMRAIPTGEVHFWRNVQASLLWTFLLCPAAWLATLGSWIHHRLKRRAGNDVTSGVRHPDSGSQETPIPLPVVGVTCCLILPIAFLWRDADVQIHPRYAMIILPAAIIVCSSLYSRWASSSRAAVTWVIVQLLVFGIAQIGIQPLRQIQAEKREYTSLVRASLPGEALLIPGGYSPIMDYYRALGERPEWRILWSGWGWEERGAEKVIREAWSRHTPVYLCDGPSGWLYFEDEFLDLFFIFRNSRKVEIAPHLYRIYPDQ